jgi:hypothetical protein
VRSLHINYLWKNAEIQIFPYTHAIPDGEKRVLPIKTKHEFKGFIITTRMNPLNSRFIPRMIPVGGFTSGYLVVKSSITALISHVNTRNNAFVQFYYVCRPLTTRFL